MLPRILLLHVRGEVRGRVLADLELAVETLLDVAQALGQDAALAEGVLRPARLQVALDLRHRVDHLLQVGVMEMVDLELEIE